MNDKLVQQFLECFENNVFEVLYDEDKNSWSDSVQLPDYDEIVFPPQLDEAEWGNITMDICDKCKSKVRMPSKSKFVYLDRIVDSVAEQANKYTNIKDIGDVQPYMMPRLRERVRQYFTPYPNSTGSSKNKAQPKQLERTFRLLGCGAIYDGIEVLRHMMPTPIEDAFYSYFRTLLSEYGQMGNKYPNMSKVRFTHNGVVHTIDTQDRVQGAWDKELYYSCYQQCKNSCRKSVLQALLIVSTSKDEFLTYSNSVTFA